MQYRKFIAGLEIAGGAGLLVMSSRNSRTMSYMLLLFCVGAMLHSYQTLGDPIAKVYSLLASGAVVIVAMIIDMRFVKNIGASSPTKKDKKEKDKKHSSSKTEDKKSS